MVCANPFAEFRHECEVILSKAVETALPECKIEVYSLGKPANPNYGQLASPICFELAKKLKKKPADLAPATQAVIITICAVAKVGCRRIHKFLRKLFLILRVHP
jgi:arginyl-tRNA synthetase